MKKQNKILAVAVGALFSATAFAQSATPVAPFNPQAIQQGAPAQSQSSLATPTMLPPGQGNVFEREVTPLLRETSRKKSLLELKKLDAEIEKVDAEMLKAQQEKLAPRQTGGQVINVQDLNNPMMNLPSMIPNGQPQQLPQANQMQSMPMSNDSGSSSGIKVISILGFDEDLFAKVSSGQQGGYVVRKGDTLPNGQVVVSVKPNFIEVRNGKSSGKGGVKKIYATGYPTETPGMSMPQPASSANITPNGNAMGPIGMPGMQTTSFSLPAPNNGLNITPLTGN